MVGVTQSHFCAARATLAPHRRRATAKCLAHGEPPRNMRVDFWPPPFPRSRRRARARATAVPGGRLPSPAMVRSRERATRSCADLATIDVSPCRTSGRWSFRVKDDFDQLYDKCRVRQVRIGSNNIHIKLRLFAVEKREAREFPRLAFDTFIIRLFGRKIFRPFQKKLGFGERTVTAR